MDKIKLIIDKGICQGKLAVQTALAYASVLAKGDDPSKYVFDQYVLRSHLHNCLSERVFTVSCEKEKKENNHHNYLLFLKFFAQVGWQKQKKWFSVPSVSNGIYHLNVCVNVSEDVIVKGHCFGTALHVMEQHVKDRKICMAITFCCTKLSLAKTMIYYWLWLHYWLLLLKIICNKVQYLWTKVQLLWTQAIFVTALWGPLGMSQFKRDYWQ